MPLQLYKISSTELNSTTTTVTFSNIPQGYTDLKIVVSGRIDTTTSNFMISFNGSTSSFGNKVLYGTGSGMASTTYVRFAGYACQSTDPVGTFGNSELYIPNYTSNTNKTYSSDNVSENNGTYAVASINAGLWSSSDAITSISLSPDSGNFVSGSTFTLYGIL
jgi:hypothetical protein